MSKKLKKKIEELCGLTDLGWEARQERAHQILKSPDWKQQLCNELQGLSFRELERYLSAVATERQKREESYERKLEAYRGDKSSSQTSTNISKKSQSGAESTRPKPRSIEEILAQVYAPRVVSNFKLSESEKLVISKYKPVPACSDVPPDPNNEHDSSME